MRHYQIIVARHGRRERDLKISDNPGSAEQLKGMVVTPNPGGTEGSWGGGRARSTIGTVAYYLRRR
jgi:hypothetical protein